VQRNSVKKETSKALQVSDEDSEEDKERNK
jgi:hypothetical protein